MTELKPCPFCNGRAELKHYTIEGYEPDRMYYVECSKCGQTVVHGKFDTTYHSDKWAINKAITVWNKRPNPWHTGTPTEDGTFLVLWKDTDEPMRRFSVLHWNEYNNTWYDEETTCCNWGDEDHAEVIAWQKIEPYEEANG